MGDQSGHPVPGDRVNVEEALRCGDNERSLLQVWDLVSERGMWQHAVEDAWHRGDAEDVGSAQSVLDELPEVTALQALQANARLVDLLTERRWFVMRQAREEGASWTAIAGALGTTEHAACDWYRHQIELHELHGGDLHDTERARAALDD